ncbi:hypothetical protein SEUCBS139899_002556 [Sporothrix eucalyptigena]|uniref:Major facilitator superfamily (MFS) profile domain-containing protein n=1 Tax=Sporothrix eucalyptigena TaxID=1812306 RepID=A0ABP0B3H9_9PEZI
MANFISVVRERTQYFNRRLFLSVGLIALSSLNYGFDNQAFSTTESMTAFQKTFGVYNAKTHTYSLPSVWLSLFNSLNYITFGIGVLFGSFISNRFGRRWCMFSMSCYALVSATVCVTSQNKSQIMAARILNYFYIGMELSVVPMFQSEIVPAPIRGLAVATYQLSITLGGLVINGTCFATNNSYSDNRSWRVPLGLFYIIPTIIISGIWFVPESPRWLLQKNRNDEARHNLGLLRQGATRYPSEGVIDQEFEELQKQLERESEKGAFLEIFRGRTNLKRTLVVAVINFFQQASGQGFISQYGAVYVKSLNTFNSTLFSLMNSGISVAVIIAVLITSDKIGRRTSLYVSGIVMIAALYTMGGVGTQPTPLSTASKRGIMSMMTIYGVGFAIGWGPLTYVVATEIPALRLREHTLRFGFLINVIFNFAVNFAIPYLISADYANLGSKVGFIFGSIMVMSMFFVYFCVPECKDKSLEQIDYLFHNGTRLRDFGKIAPASVALEVVFEKAVPNGDVEAVTVQLKSSSNGKP